MSSTTAPLFSISSSSSYLSSNSSSDNNKSYHHHHHHHRLRVAAVNGNGSAMHLFSSSTSSSIHQQNRSSAGSFPSCEVALKPDASASYATEEEDAEMSRAQIGARVRVRASELKVFHVSKVPEIDIAGMEGELKQYVNLWKGKRISANFPFKVEFYTEIEGRGRVKFSAHLKEDEFEYI